MALWWALRSLVLWILSILHFLVVGVAICLMCFVRSSRAMDAPITWWFRNMLSLAGARMKLRVAEGFEPHRTAMFVCNHVNIFDPMVVMVSAPQHLRGMELASHFKIPIYGWLATRLGNIPVPKVRGKAEVKELERRIQESLDADVSMMVFAEGHRTRDGHVAPFKRGVFQMAVENDWPIIPMSITGSYEFKRYNSMMLKPAEITVWLHETVETTDLGREDVDALRGRVHETISRPVEEAIRGDAWSPQLAAYREVRSADDLLSETPKPQAPIPS